MDLDSNPFEVVAVAALTVNSVSSDGRSNGLEGVLLLATYLVLGLAFFFHPQRYLQNDAQRSDKR